MLKLNKCSEYFVIVLVLGSVFLVCGCVSFGARSPLVTGQWESDTFTNRWTDITFELPAGFRVLPIDEYTAPGQRNDFTLVNEDYTAVISLTYIDVSSGKAQNHTPEDYLNIVREQLADSPNRVYTFSESFESAVIAGREYVVMRAEFVNNDNPAEVVFQDGYAHRFVNTMLVFITTYSEETRDTVDLFLSSIRQVQ